LLGHGQWKNLSGNAKIASKGELAMASKRCLPTRFFKDADIMNVSKDAQLILVGLVLLADDEGRELAHPKLLSREIDYSPEQIEAALQELVENDLIVLYQGGKHRYYSLTRWSQWQSLSSQKITLSRYPAPPEQVDLTEVPEGNVDEHVHITESSQNFPIFPREIPGKLGKNREVLSQVKLSESNLSESKSIEGEDEGQPPPNIVTFPAARDAADINSHPSEKIFEVTKQVATILKLTVTDSLTRVIADYVHDPKISLFGEADAAREWIDDPERNRKRQRLTPAFFRRWLKREQESYQHRYTQSASPPGRSAAVHASAGQRVVTGAGPPGSANTADNPYHAFVEKRARALLLSTKGDGYAHPS
jgi:hypothetical protein